MKAQWTRKISLLNAVLIGLAPGFALPSKQLHSAQTTPWSTKSFDEDDLPCLPVKSEKKFSANKLASPDNAYLMMAASYLAYSFWPGKRQRILANWGFKEIHIFDAHSSSTNGYWAEHNEFVLVALRGTQEPRDLVTDVKVHLQPLWQDGRSFLVHRGFQDAASSISLEVEDAANHARKVNKPLLLTGHSLGGAVALLTALKLEMKNKPVGAVWTFGAPKVGNNDFFDFAKVTLKNRWLRINEESDPIPALPFTREDRPTIMAWSERLGGVLPLLQTLAANADYDNHPISPVVQSSEDKRVAISKRSLKQIARGFINHLPRSYVCKLSDSSEEYSSNTQLN